MTKDELIDSLIKLQDEKQALEYLKNTCHDRRSKILKELSLRKMNQQIESVTNRLYHLTDNNREEE